MNSRKFLFIISLLIAGVIKATEVYQCGYATGEYCRLISEKEEKIEDVVEYSEYSEEDSKEEINKEEIDKFNSSLEWMDEYLAPKSSK